MDKCLCCDCTALTLTPSTIAPFIVERTGRDRRCKSVACARCGAIFLDVRYTDEEMSRIYTGYRDATYNKRRLALERDYAPLQKWFDAPVPYMEVIEELLTPYLTFPVSILDYGGDTGMNAPFIGKRTLHIYDIGNSPIIDGVRVEKPEGIYDLVVCANVLEHVPDPLTVLQSLTQYMDAHSVLYLELPWEPILAEDNPSKYIREWHEHINLFMPESISIMLKRCGLELLAVDKVIVKILSFGLVQYLMVVKLYAAD